MKVPLFLKFFLICSVSQTMAEVSPPRRMGSPRASVSEGSWWRADQMDYSIGYEGTGSTTSPLAQNAASIGIWFDRSWGLEVLFGVTKAAGTESETATTADTVTTKVRTVTTAYTGSSTSAFFLVGGLIKYRLYQSDWFQFYSALLMGFTPKASSSNRTGTTVLAIANYDTPDTHTRTETALGTVTRESSSMLSLGPKLGTEFYIKWLPHLAVGFATGVLTTFGGNTTTTTETRSRTVTVTGGTDGTVTGETTTKIVDVDTRGTTGTTFGIGGTNFQFTGIFTIRYIW